ncbi:coiled-coil domain-containing protein 179 [Canis lupus baileyi]|uniref:coiled-coil domain-containing protein 179 n=1 Tax=Canis lupus baileyi TaxID=143281 RepID=UPI000BAA1D0A|nr:coiled-coil domain-containing protein 179 isoform X1 [Canis lupus dingo]XP_038285405.1 coiled-coil domain-containing protein 179 isoform X1 [Canis lupus familiaris]|eukprot:XP_022263138.1 coiled-coil domain-containing protein 179 isoform X1 [Canis lupus familiaris]
MCLCCTEDDAIQVNPVSAQGPPSPWGPVIPTIRKGQDGSILRKSLQGRDKRIENMKNIRKEKRKFNKRFARPAPLPEPGLLWT